MTRYCLPCSKRVGPGHVCAASLHRVKDDEVFVLAGTTNHWWQCYDRSGEHVETRWVGGAVWRDTLGNDYLEIGKP